MGPLVSLDRPSDPLPYLPTLVIAAPAKASLRGEHQVLQTGSFKLRIGAMLSDQQIGRPPDIKIGDHSGALASNGRNRRCGQAAR
jgi:hypothetical protein